MHAVEEQFEAPAVSSTLPPEQEAETPDIANLIINMQREGCNDSDIVAAVKSASNPRGRAPYSAQRQGSRSQSTPSRQRARTPPRDPKDHKCANCNEKGHSHLACPHPPKPLEKRKCHE